MAHRDTRKILRVGVIQDGAIVEERLLRRREAVTVGTALKNTFCVTASGLPHSMTFFDVRSGQYHLHFDEAMQGRISIGDGVHTLSDLRQSGRAQHHGERGWSLALDERARGKVVLGGAIFLFQFVTAPPAKTTPPLPVTLQAGPLTFFNNTVELTGTYGLALLFSLVVQVGLVTYLVVAVPPPPRPVGVADLPDEIRMIITSMEEPPTLDLAEQVTDDGEIVESAVEAEEEAEEQAQPEQAAPERTSERNAPSEAGPRTHDERLRLARSTVRDEAFWSSLTAPSEGGVGDPMAQIFNSTDATIGEVLAAQRARGEGSLAGPIGSLSAGDGDGDGGGQTVNVDIGRSRTSERAERVDSGNERERVRVEASILQSPTQTAGSGHLDENSLNDELRRRVRDVRRCYQRVLGEDPSLGGRVVLQFTIDTGGRVSDVRFVENQVGSRVGDCIEGHVRRWRFDPPQGGSVTVRKTYILAPAD